MTLAALLVVSCGEARHSVETTIAAAEVARVVEATAKTTARVRVSFAPPEVSGLVAELLPDAELADLLAESGWEGVVDPVHGRLQLESFGVLGEASEQTELIRDGSRLYLRVGRGPWRNHTAKDYLSDGYLDPVEMLQQVRDVGTLVEVGHESVRGSRTTRYRKPRTASGDNVEVWIDDVGHLVRIQTKPSLGPSSSEPRRSTRVVEFWDFGLPTNISVPSTAGPTS